MRNLLTNSIFKKVLTFIDKYYFIAIGLYFLYNAFKLWHVRTGIDFKLYWVMLAVASFTAYKEIRKDVKIIPFLLFTIPIIIFVWYLEKHGYEIWGKIINWEMGLKVVFNLNKTFSCIPFNDASFARVYKSPTLTHIMRLVYNNGFVLPVIIPMYRSAISKDFSKMLKYLLSAHIFQVFLITPFYVTFRLNEVWYVLGQPDGLARHLNAAEAAKVTLNCFPSMHTSIAFAIFILVLREKDVIFKTIWSIFCLSVIFSTMYLEIHWVIDVIAGMILAYATVKLVDFVMDKSKIITGNLLNRFYYRTPLNI